MMSDRLIKNKIILIVAGVIVILFLGFIDIVTGYEIAFSIFYLIPIGIITWLGGLRNGILLAVAGAITWSFSDYTAGNDYAHPLIFYWNALSSLGFFVFIAIVLARLKKSLDHEKSLARTDHLTRVSNARAFTEILDSEINISLRYDHPFTVIYMDVDNFKSINDTLGHNTGDEVLSAIADTIRQHVRATDVVARLGGDEFAILLRETGYEHAAVTIAKISKNLTALTQKDHWPITFSIGAITYTRSAHSVDEVIRSADRLMYTVKNSTKNGIRHERITL